MDFFDVIIPLNNVKKMDEYSLQSAKILTWTLHLEGVYGPDLVMPILLIHVDILPWLKTYMTAII